MGNLKTRGMHAAMVVKVATLQSITRLMALWLTLRVLFSSHLVFISTSRNAPVLGAVGEGNISVPHSYSPDLEVSQIS